MKAGVGPPLAINVLLASSEVVAVAMVSVVVTGQPRVARFSRKQGARCRTSPTEPGDPQSSRAGLRPSRSPDALCAETTHYGMCGTPRRPAPKWGLVSRGREGQQADRSLKAEVTRATAKTAGSV
jgi:hypothetical protein